MTRNRFESTHEVALFVLVFLQRIIGLSFIMRLVKEFTSLTKVPNESFKFVRLIQIESHIIEI